MNDVTQILHRIDEGESAATDELLPLVYHELRQLASSRLRNEPATQSMDATVLVHEAYLRLVDGDQVQNWANRAHFFGAAAEAMRRILIDQARARKSLKRGGGERTLSLDSVGEITDRKAAELVQLDAALDRLEEMDANKAKLVKLKFFVGTTTETAAEILGLPLRTAERQWAFARAWLYREMED